MQLTATQAGCCANVVEQCSILRAAFLSRSDKEVNLRSIVHGSRFAEQFIDVGLTIADAYAGCIRTGSGHVASSAQTFNPANALLVFDGSPVAFLLSLGLRKMRVQMLASPRFLPHGSQRNAVRTKGHQRMQKGAPSGFAVHRPGSGNLLDGTREIQFGGILHQQHLIAL